MFVLGPLLHTNVAAMGGSAGGGSGRSWAATTNWTLTSGYAPNATAEHTAVTTFWEPIPGSAGLTGDFTCDFRIDAVGTLGTHAFGVSTLSETVFPGNDAAQYGVGIEVDMGSPGPAGIYFGGYTGVNRATTFAATDIVRFQRVGNTVSISRQAGGSGAFDTPDTVNVVGSPAAGTVFPMLSEGNHTGFKVTLL